MTETIRDGPTTCRESMRKKRRAQAARERRAWKVFTRRLPALKKAMGMR